MSGIEFALNKAFNKAKQRQWDKLYFSFDIHETMIYPDYTCGRGVIPTQLYPYALEALQLIARRGDIVMLLNTCSHPEEIEQYLEHFRSLGINFQAVNKNPFVETNKQGFGCYDDKFYCDVLFEDKAGFNAEQDWLFTLEYLKNEPKLCS